MNIIYFTTALDNKDYESYLNIWKKKPNPSNQNFHNKLIRTLALSHHVDVISFRPFSKSNTTVKGLEKDEKVVTNIHWHYLPVKGGKITRMMNEYNVSKALVANLDKNSIIITDTINPLVLYSAAKASKKLKLPIIGVATDSPSNITGTKKSYTLFLLNRAKHLNGYIALTKELEEMFNESHAPSTIIEGIVDEYEPNDEIKIDGDYLFFGGALLPRYGIYNLIDAFNALDNKQLKLVICGHHAEQPKLSKMISANENIIYLDTLHINKVIYLEKHALACINPRPYSEDLDRYSIPSKTLEYFASGRPTISVKNSKLQKLFYNDAIWLKSGSVEDIKEGIQKVLKLPEKERDLLGKSAKINVNKLFSLVAVNQKVDELIDQVK